jgi:hypothetical protein
MGSGIQRRYGRQRHGSTQGRAVRDGRDITFAQPASADYKVRTDPEPANAGPARHWLIFPVVSENSCHLKVAIYLTSRRGAIITSQGAENNHLWTYSGAQASRPPAPNTKPVGIERHGWLAGNQKPGVTPCAGPNEDGECGWRCSQVLQMRYERAGRVSNATTACCFLGTSCPGVLAAYQTPLPPGITFMRMSAACWGRPRSLSGETGGKRNLNRKKPRFARLRHRLLIRVFRYILIINSNLEMRQLYDGT